MVKLALFFYFTYFFTFFTSLTFNSTTQKSFPLPGGLQLINVQHITCFYCFLIVSITCGSAITL